MLLALGAVIGGLVVLVWSADRFIDGAAATARHFGMSPLLIGMVVVGFGTSAPELMVSALASLQDNPGLALGNAYGSNIANIALILGCTALLRPITVRSQVLRKELPILTLVTLLAAVQLWDGFLSRADAWVLLVVFAGLMSWTIIQGMRQKDDTLNQEMEQELSIEAVPLPRAIGNLLLGLCFLIASSRLLVWGAVDLAHAFGVSDLIIGLTIVAIGTSLPELASSLMAARKGEHDIALGNIIGSNLFNTLAVVGLAGAIQPIKVAPEVLHRDWLIMTILTLSLFFIGYGFRGPGRINRWEASVLLLVYISYSGWLLKTALGF